MIAPIYDTADTTFRAVPSNPAGLLVYMDRHFANISAARARFPELFKAGRVLTLTAGEAHTAEGIDWELGNADPAIVPWVNETRQAGTKRPAIYADLSDMRNRVAELEAAGQPPGSAGDTRSYRILTAHPTGQEHICGPSTCGQLPYDADGTQYWWSSLSGHSGQDYDVSVVRDDFFGVKAAVVPAGLDPMHYEWYDAGARAQCGNSVERSLVERYDVLRSFQPLKDPIDTAELDSIRHQLKCHANRLLTLMRDYAHPGEKYNTQLDHMGWRFYRLVRRINGETVAREN